MRGLKIKNQVGRPDTPLANTPEPNGTYMAFSNGRLARTNPIYKESGNLESIDTTGYSKGKKQFEKITSNRVINKVNVKKEKVERKDVPKVISDLKKGATRVDDYRTNSQKKKNKI